MTDFIALLLFVVLVVEIISYRSFNAKVDHLELIEKSIADAFSAIGAELVKVELKLDQVESKSETYDNNFKTMQENMELVATYLELYRDALAIKEARYSGIGTIKPLE